MNMNQKNLAASAAKPTILQGEQARMQGWAGGSRVRTQVERLRLPGEAYGCCRRAPAGPGRDAACVARARARRPSEAAPVDDARVDDGLNQQVWNLYVALQTNRGSGARWGEVGCVKAETAQATHPRGSPPCTCAMAMGSGPYMPAARSR